MNRLFESANRYIQSCSWRDFALLKFCLASMGVLIGLSLPAKGKKPAAWVAAAVFAATYIPLMRKFLPFLAPAKREDHPG
ncbi:MAG: permease of phosphate ABC transporter [Oscillibacter sp.]